MEKPIKTRLYFIDAMRAWAIMMMLQGHFIDGLLNPVFRDPNSIWFNIWLYFRGITAPVFFTVSGFIFTYLLLRTKETGWENPRVRKGIKRGFQLLAIGYILRLNLGGLFQGIIYPSFFIVDVLHCIGISILIITSLYLLVGNRTFWLPRIMIPAFILIFLFEPIYKNLSLEGWPEMLSNYFLKNKGSVFTIIPWVGYAMAGACLTFIYRKYSSYRRFYQFAIPSFFVIGYWLSRYSSDFFGWIHLTTQIDLFEMIMENNYLFVRLGDVLIVFAVFMLFKERLTHPTLIKIGGNTLSIYVFHYMLLYGSLTGIGLYRFFKYSLTPMQSALGALLFILVCVSLALWYDRHENKINKWLPFLRWFQS